MIKAIQILGFTLLSMSVFSQSNTDMQIFYVSLDTAAANPVKEYQVTKYNGKIKGSNKIHILPDVTFQTMEGIGGAFNEIGGEALLSLNDAQQHEVLGNLFGAENAGFSFCRTAIGASDFGINEYSYSTVPEDYEMDKFSIERDKKYVIPYLKLAVNINPELKIFASPWSPPGWMKENGSMTGVDNEHSKLRSEEKIYKAYAIYFSKYIQAYKENGIDVSRICVQNETDISTKYPSCIMKPEQLLDLSLNYIKPEFQKKKIATEVYAGTFRVAGEMHLLEFLTLKNASKMDGIGVQYTSPRYLCDASFLNTRMKFMHTEGACYNGDNSVRHAEERLAEISNYINSNCVNFCYWNIILNETKKSGWDWAQNSLININRETKTVIYNPEYNVMYIVSKFIRPDDKRVASYGNGPMITVKDQKGTIKVLLQNNEPKEAYYSIRLEGGKETFFAVPPRAVFVVVVNQNKI